MVPLVGIIPAGLFLYYLMGAIMSVGTPSADIVRIMGVELGVPFWAFLFLILAQWTTEVVSAYSAGLGLTNMFNLNGERRGLVTALGAFLGTIAALIGILDMMEGFLYTLAVAYPVVGTIMAVDYYILRNKEWTDIPGINWMAFLTFVISCAVGVIFNKGYVTLNVIVVSAFLYYLLMVIQGKLAPNQFTPSEIKDGTYNVSFADPFLSLGFIGALVSAILPIFVTGTWGDVGAVIGTGLVGLGFLLKLKQSEKAMVTLNTHNMEKEYGKI